MQGALTTKFDKYHRRYIAFNFKGKGNAQLLFQNAGKSKSFRVILSFSVQITPSPATEYKNSSWVCGWDRKIRPEDHRLASRGLPSDDKRWSWDRKIRPEDHRLASRGLPSDDKRWLWDRKIPPEDHRLASRGLPSDDKRWLWDRKIPPEDHRLASRGLPSDDKRWSRGTDFSIPSSHE